MRDFSLRMEVLYIDDFELRQQVLLGRLERFGIESHALLLGHREGEIIADTVLELRDLEKLEAAGLSPEMVRQSSQVLHESVVNDRDWILKQTIMPFIQTHGGFENHVLIINCISAQRLDIFRLLDGKVPVILVSCKSHFKTIERLQRTIRMGIISTLPDKVLFDHDPSYGMEKAAELVDSVVKGKEPAGHNYLHFSSIA